MMNISKQKGFTLIEVMVAVSVFAIVITVGIGALMNVNRGFRQAQLQRAAIDNVAFAMESMAREIRIGERYSLGTSVLDWDNYHVGLDTEFSFRSFNINNDNDIDSDDDVTYRHVSVNGIGRIMMKIGSGQEQALTSDDVNVQRLVFRLNESSKRQPYVSIHILATATRGNQDSDILLQTSVSQRRINVDPNPS